MNSKHILIFALILLINYPIYAAEENPCGDENPCLYYDTIDNFSKTVVFLRAQSPVIERKGNEQVEVWYKNPETGELTQKFNQITGTGFIVLHNEHSYLVTAKHIAIDFSKERYSGMAEIIANITDGKAYNVSFDLLQNLEIIPNARWFYHPEVDIAIHPIAVPKNMEILSIPSRKCSKDDINLKVLTKCYVIGFPLGLGLGERVSPLTKETYIASGLTTINFPNFNPNLKYILLDDPIAQGFSGSPVFQIIEVEKKFIQHFRWAGAKPDTIECKQLVGLVSGTISDQTGGKISLIIPITYLWDIFNSTDFKNYEKSIPNK